jgi:hypothetical protein
MTGHPKIGRHHLPELRFWFPGLGNTQIYRSYTDLMVRGWDSIWVNLRKAQLLGGGRSGCGRGGWWYIDCAGRDRIRDHAPAASHRRNNLSPNPTARFALQVCVRETAGWFNPCTIRTIHASWWRLGGSPSGGRIALSTFSTPP